MITFADLHTHTTASDGQYTPSELAALAKTRGLDVLAVTDHDTIAGVDAAAAAGARLGLRVIRGVELSAKEYPNFHILGYGFRPDAPALSSLCEKLRAGRDDRKYRILSFLQEKGISLSLEEVEELAGGEVIARPHFARALVRRGYVSSNREAFDRYLDSEEFRQRVGRFKADARTCIEVIKAAGGWVSLAHPCQLQLPEEALDAMVRRLRGWGLDAIECDYPTYTPAERSFYRQLTVKYQLRRTGGSDFHGEKVKPQIHLAALPLELGWLLEPEGSAAAPAQ